MARLDGEGNKVHEFHYVPFFTTSPSSGGDRFELEVGPPFGQEKIFVYASPSPLGDIALEAEGGVYRVKSGEKDIGIKTRGINLVEKAGGKKVPASEFYEGTIELITRK